MAKRDEVEALATKAWRERIERYISANWYMNLAQWVALIAVGLAARSLSRTTSND